MYGENSIPNGTFSIGQEVKVIKAIRGWFDYSVKSEVPVGTIGSIFKIEKINQNLEDIEYTVKFESEFDFVKIKHEYLNNL
jgi:hypothetical protein